MKKLTRAEKEAIWLRYQLYAYNRPGMIAADYNICAPYVINIGKRKDPCQPLHLANKLRKSLLTSSPRMSNGPSAIGAKAGLEK